MIELGRLLLAAVFAVAGVAKLADREGSRNAARDFGAPDRLASPLALLLPIVELTIAAALGPAFSGRVAAGVAAGLLVVFTLAVANALLRGRRPDCHCFGRLHSAPAGPGTLVRNAVLAAGAVVLASQPASNPSRFELVAAAAAVVFVGQALLSWTLLRRYGRALRRIEELQLEAAPVRAALQVGAEAPAFTAAGAEGEITLAGLLARSRPVLLVFTDSGCGPCRMLLPKVAVWRDRFAEEVNVVLLEDEPGVAELYGVAATPGAVLIGPDGKIAHAFVAGGSAIEELVRSLAAQPEPAVNGNARVVTAAALAGGLAATAAAAHAATGARFRSDLDPELQAIDDLLRSAGAGLVAASNRSRLAVRAQATLRKGRSVRAKRAAAKRALATERRQVLTLRTRVDELPGSTPAARNVKTLVDASLFLFAQSLQRQEHAIGAAPRTARKLTKEAQALFVRSVGSLAAAGTLLGHGQ